MRHHLEDMRGLLEVQVCKKGLFFCERSQFTREVLLTLVNFSHSCPHCLLETLFGVYFVSHNLEFKTADTSTFRPHTLVAQDRIH
jgi:hypothetical protein